MEELLWGLLLMGSVPPSRYPLVRTHSLGEDIVETFRINSRLNWDPGDVRSLQLFCCYDAAIANVKSNTISCYLRRYTKPFVPGYVCDLAVHKTDMASEVYALISSSCSQLWVGSGVALCHTTLQKEQQRTAGPAVYMCPPYGYRNTGHSNLCSISPGRSLSALLPGAW